MSKFLRFLKLSLLAIALVCTVVSFVPPQAIGQTHQGGNCQSDCGCNGGSTGCCELPNGATCLRSP